MLDIKALRQDPDKIREGMKAKKTDPKLVDEVLQFDEKRRDLLQKTETLKARKNQVSKKIPQKAKAGESIDELKEESKKIGEEIKGIDEELREVEQQQNAILLSLPNMPHESTPVGHDEADNEIVRSWNEPIKKDFKVLNHIEIGEKLGILDLERGAKVSGSGFYFLRGLGSKLERALIAWMLDTHTSKNGYEEVTAPHLVSRQTMTGTGQLPKMEEDMYLAQEDDLFLIPTAEVPVTNLYANEILSADELPKKFVGFTPCYRREAGGYGKEVRGMTRVHQFSKVEMVQYALPETSYEVLEDLTRNATELLEALQLPYRILSLCSGDISFAAAKCYDLEIWSPASESWLEVSSCSNFEDFQARRANIRFRREQGAKPEFVHTLNGSGLAIPRIMVGIMENYQNEDGSITIPEVLQPFMGTNKIS